MPFIILILSYPFVADRSLKSNGQPNRLVGFDPDTQKFFSVTEIKSGGGSVRHMFFHQASREIWFGTDKNTVGRARIP